MPRRGRVALNEARHKLRLKWAAFFQDFDLLLCPAAASAACPHDHVGGRYQRTIAVNGKQVPTTDQLFWAGLSCVAYLPSTVAPIGFTKTGLPIGVQIVGPQFGDRTCIAFAKLLEQDCSFVAPWGITDGSVNFHTETKTPSLRGAKRRSDPAGSARTPSCPALGRASTSFLSTFQNRKTWMAGTSPAMTAERLPGTPNRSRASLNIHLQRGDEHLLRDIDLPRIGASSSCLPSASPEACACA